MTFSPPRKLYYVFSPHLIIFPASSQRFNHYTETLIVTYQKHLTNIREKSQISSFFVL